MSRRVAQPAALILLSLLISCREAEPVRTPSFSAAQGSLVPDLRMTTLEGEQLSLASLRGKPVLVNFWASWCKPCREEFPLLQEAIDELGIQVIGVVFQDTDARALAFKNKLGAAWPMVKDPSGNIAKGFRVTRPPGIPQTVFIDPKGVYRTKLLGQMSKDLLRETVEGLD